MEIGVREIKFRAWSIKKKEMFDNLPECLDAYDLNSVFSDKYLGYVIMQYTGLKDKKGVEIYESDILRSIENDNVYLVEQIIPIQRTDNLTRLGVYINDEYHKVPEELLLGDDWKSWPEMYEVIGNIYANPELLKQ